MAIRKFTENVSVISALPDSPSPPEYNAAILKAKFDEAAIKLKSYINDTLIPDIENTATEGICAVKKELAVYNTPGEHTFDTAEHPSAGGVYDIVLVGGGGGGSKNSLGTASSGTGGGSGAVRKVVGVPLDGEYLITVGAGGTGGVGQGTNGGSTYMRSGDYSFFKNAEGGGASSQNSKIGIGGGIGAGDSEYGDGTVGYGRGGDNEYGRGARGAALSDDVIPAQGVGAGGWSDFAATPGAVIIYGYVRI